MNISTLLKQSSHYCAAYIFSLLLGFISFPVLTRILSTDQYGILGLINILIWIVVAFSKGGLSNGIIRYFDIDSGCQTQLKVVNTAMLASVVFAVGISGIYCIVVTLLCYVPGIDFVKTNFSVLIIVVIYLIGRPVNIAILNLMRAGQSSKLHNFINSLDKFLSVALGIGFVYYFSGSLFAYFIGVALAQLVALFVSVKWLVGKFSLAKKYFDSSILIEFVKFGFPLLSMEITFLLLQYADRFIITSFLGTGKLGIYTAGYNLANYLADLVGYPISAAIVPIYMNIYNQKGREETTNFLEKVMRYMLPVSAYIFFSFYIIRKDLFVFLAGEKYLTAASVAPVILLGLVFMALNNIMNAGLIINKMTKYMLFIMLFSLLINIILNILLIPDLGIMGAAIATCIACIISFLCVWYISGKEFSINLQCNLLFVSLVAGFIAIWISSYINYGSPLMNLIAKGTASSMIMIVPIILFDTQIKLWIRQVLGK